MLFLTQIVLGQLLELHLLVTGLIVIVIVLSMPDGIMGLIGSLIGKTRVAPAAVEAGS